jgi:hypothetical protein
MTPVVAGAFASALLASLFTAVGWAVLAQSLARRLGRHSRHPENSAQVS